jgi:probable rRNA maturation factor
MRRTALKIDVIVDSDRWKEVAKLNSTIRGAVARAGAALSTTRTELAIVLTDDSTIRALNREWRGIDAATNVLSFPAKEANGKQFGRHLGDIVLAFETIAREARREGKPLNHHVAHLAVHGFLHLAGYDHERDKDALEMEQAERDILRQLAIPDPYRPKAKHGAKHIANSRARDRNLRGAGRSARHAAGPQRKF